MPKQGETFVNAVGVEVVAHGGSTPAASPLPVRKSARVGSSETRLDVYGRRYDPSVPVFMPTGTRFVYDRLQVGPSSLVDIDTLIAKAASLSWTWGTTEIGMPSDEWLELNTPPTTIQPGYGTGSDPYAHPPVNIQRPLIAGLTDTPGTLVCSTGGWFSNPPASFAYQWRRDGVVIAGAVTDTLDWTIEDDLGRVLDCVVTATNDHGAEAAPSVAVQPVIPQSWTHTFLTGWRAMDDTGHNFRFDTSGGTTYPALWFTSVIGGNTYRIRGEFLNFTGSARRSTQRLGTTTSGAWWEQTTNGKFDRTAVSASQSDQLRFIINDRMRVNTMELRGVLLEDLGVQPATEEG